MLLHGVLSTCERQPFALGHTDAGSGMGSSADSAEAEQTQFHGRALPLLVREAMKTQTRSFLLCEMRGGKSPVAHCRRWHGWSAALMVSGAHTLGLVCWQRLLFVGLFLLAGGFHSWQAPGVLRHLCEECCHFYVGSSTATWVAAPIDASSLGLAVRDQLVGCLRKHPAHFPFPDALHLW